MKDPIDNYSFLNNYTYKNKSKVMSTLDFLSTPCRKALGGRNVNILSQTYHNPTSTAGKVATVFFSVLIFPVAVISTASLLIKFASFPGFWEKKKIKEQTKDTWKVINAFNQAFDKKDYNSAIQNFKQRSEIIGRKDVGNKFFKIVNSKINNIDPWNEIQDLLPYMSTRDSIELINHMVKTRLAHEVKNDRFEMQGDQVNRFIVNSLRVKSKKNIEECCKKLFSGALQINVDDDLITNAIKMDILRPLIDRLASLQASEHTSEFRDVAFDIKKGCLMHSPFIKGQRYSDYYLMLSDDKNMEKVSSAVQGLRDASHVQKCLDAFNALAGNPDLQSQSFRDEVVKFQSFLKNMSFKSQEIEKNYYGILLEYLKHMTDFIDAISESSSHDEINKLAKNVQDNLQNQIKEFKKYFNKDTTVSYSKSTTDNLVATLCLKKRIVLFTAAEQIKSVLIKEMCNKALKRLQEEVCETSAV